MSNIKTTNKKECPDCGSTSVRYKGGINYGTSNPNGLHKKSRKEPQKKTLICIDCKNIFQYTGTLNE